MTPVIKSCSECNTPFTISTWEQSLLSRLGPQIDGQLYYFPPSDQCPLCREQARLAFRNERNLFYRTCGLTGKRILTLYSPDKPYQVYSYDAWWSNAWDETAYGREFDFNRTFFEQFAELWRSVPLAASFGGHNENSEYTNHCSHVKNCYLLFAANRNEDCLYSEYVWDSKNCLDCTMIIRGQYLWNCVSCTDCYSCFSSDQCERSRDLRHCFDCNGSNNLFACAGLRNASYMILNQAYSPEQYAAVLADPIKCQEILTRYQDLLAATPRLAAKVVRSENCTGHELEDSRNVVAGFQSFGIEDGMYIENSPGALQDLLDISGATHTKLSYQLGSVAFGYNLAFSLFSYNHLRDSFYTVLCHKGQNLFGCVGVKNGEYMILNRKYSQKDYYALLKKIINHMQATGEWGRFFPVAISPWCYNESVAGLRMPLTKEQVLKKGWKWKAEELEEQNKNTALKAVVATKRPASEVDQTITQQLFTCQESGQPFRIILPELKFYQEHGLNLPVLSPNKRYQQRLTRRLPNRLWERQCMRVDQNNICCNEKISTPYSPERKELVYCEGCYLGSKY